MSRKETVFILSRMFALILIGWAVVDASYLPELALVLVAGSFWRCGPWVQALFSGEPEDQADVSA